MATTFDVLAEPTRRRILDLLLERSRPVGELVDEVDAWLAPYRRLWAARLDARERHRDAEHG
jgi:DNA-binding transcriptional ArsR family regulator